MTKSKDNCVFYDQYFLDNLESYEITKDSKIKYVSKKQEHPILVSNDLTSIIHEAHSFWVGLPPTQPDLPAPQLVASASGGMKENVWYPVFVDILNNKVKNKFLLRGSAANNLVLGVDQAIRFRGVFKDWEIVGSSDMCVDWIITSQLPSYLTEYGLLCWIQKSSYKKKPIPIDDIPVGAAIRIPTTLSYSQIINNVAKRYSINPTHYLVKLDKNKLQIFNNSDSLFRASGNSADIVNPFTFVSNDKVFDISDYLNIVYPKRVGEPDASYKNRIDIIRKNNLLFYSNIEDLPPPRKQPGVFAIDDLILYIPKGDVYSYYEDSQTKALQGLPSLTYVSSTLYQEYREIVNLLTIDFKKQKISILDQAQYRLLQKVAKFLCSHPLVDRTTISILASDECKSIINKFINGFYPTVEAEQLATKMVLRSLSELFSDLTHRIKNNNNISGYCFNDADIVKNLMSKYETYLSIETATTLTYKPGLKNGPHVRVNQNIISKTKTTIQNTIVYNNFSAQVGPYTIRSAITPTQTNFSVTDTRSRDGGINIPLWDIKKKELLTSKVIVSAGGDFIIQYVDRETNKNLSPGQEISYPMDTRNLGEIEGTILENEKIQVLWSKISGSDCLRFSDQNLNSIRNEDGTASGVGDTNLRFEESTDPAPTLYIKKPGKYVLRLKIMTSFGVFYDRITVYVVNLNGEYEVGKRPRVLLPPNLIEIKPTNGLVVICPNLREFAMGKQGVFWPTVSDLSIYSKKTNAFGEVASFGGILKKYKLLDNVISEAPCPLRMSYTPNNTTIQISRIILSHMMDNKQDCYNCPSFFQNLLDNKAFTIDVNNSFELENPATQPGPRGFPERAPPVEIAYPDRVSTDRTRVIPYGNHDTKTIADLGVVIPFHPSGPGANTASTQATWQGYNRPVIVDALVPVTGLEVDSRDSERNPSPLCHLKNVSNEKPIIFERGVFHPASGWLVAPGSKNIDHIPYANPGYFNFLNKSAVINFIPDRRKTFKFKGPGFFNLNNLSAEKTNIKDINIPNTYFSTIILAIDTEAHDAPSKSSLEQAIAKERQEINDHQQNTGYRSAEGMKTSSQAVNTDEFRVDLKADPDGAAPSADYCTGAALQNYQVSYSFPRSGPYVSENLRKPAFRFTQDISGAQIEDIEIQIDFLNYVNTKNLIIWLDVLPCSKITDTLYPRKPSDTEPGSSAKDRWSHVPENINNSIYSKSYIDTKTKIDTMENGPLKKYLQNLFEMNDNPAPEDTVSRIDINDENIDQDNSTPQPIDPRLPKSPTYRLYLLNQEHVEGNRFNFGLKFTDNIDKHTQPFDNNNNSENIDPTLIKSIEKDGIIHLLPTLSAFGYSDNDASFFRQIIQSNNLHSLNNKFKKFAGMDLFLNKDGESLGQTTQFSLGISVVNQSDTMEIIDNIVGLDSKNAIDKTVDTIRPSIIDNSICCWYLILHINNNGSQRYLPADVLGNINYEAHYESKLSDQDRSVKIPGHNFIASFKNRKYLLPPLNLNAGYAPVLDADVCKYSRESLNRPKFEIIPWNILPIILVGSAFSIGGALGEIASVDAQGDQITRDIVDFLRNIRRSEQSQSFFSSLHIPKYDKYPFGGADKILLSVSKDNVIWHKLEASIFKYSNCPIIEKRKLGYLKLNYKTAKGLSIFPFKKIDNIKDLISPDDIKIVSIPLNSAQELKTISQKSLMSGKRAPKISVENLQKTVDDLAKSGKPPNLQLNRQLSEAKILVSLFDETIYGIGVKIRKFNLVEIKKTIVRKATPESEEFGYNMNLAGLYLIPEDMDKEPIRLVDLNLPGLFTTNGIMNQLCKSSLLDFKFQNIPNLDEKTKKDKPMILNNKLIAIEGLRAFYFFNKDQDIITIKDISEHLEELRKTGPGGIAAADVIEREIAVLKQQLELAKQQKNELRIKQLEELIWDKENLLNPNRIIAKGYMYDGETYKTLIELQAPIIGKSITISPLESDTILIYDKKYATIQDKKKQPYNTWTHAETSNSIILKNKTQEISVSTFGEGSYGTGSLLVDPPVLPYKIIENRIQSLADQINIQKNSDLKPTSISIGDNNGIPIPSIQNELIKIMGYAYTSSDNRFIKNNTPATDLSLHKDVLEFVNLARFPLSGESSKIYVALDTNKTYRWIGSSYIEVSGVPYSYLNITNFFSKNHSYTQDTNDMALMNIKSDFFKNQPAMPDAGEIVFSIDTRFKLPTGTLTQADISIINSRLATLLRIRSLKPPKCEVDPDICLRNYWTAINLNILYIHDLYFYLENVSYTTPLIKTNNPKLDSEKMQEKISANRTAASLRLQNLLTEVATILYYCDIGGATPMQIPPDAIPKKDHETPPPIYISNYLAATDRVLPINKIEVFVEADGSLLFKETDYAADDYWINIDPEQGCSLDKTEMPKILLKTEYTCVLVNDMFSRDMQNICPAGFNNSIDKGIDENFKNEGNVFIYTPSAKQIKERFDQYKNLSISWPPPDSNGSYLGAPPLNIHIVSREFFINALGQERNQLVKSIETYLLPIKREDPSSTRTPDGALVNKVKDIFNLDNTQSLFVKFKRIPRKLRKYDPNYDKYTPNYLGQLTKSLLPSPGGPFDTTLQFWHCIDSKTGAYVDLPKYFKWLNEMIYRAYYGSTDAIEHSGRDLSESRETFDWIPYEYM